MNNGEIELIDPDFDSLDEWNAQYPASEWD